MFNFGLFKIYLFQLKTKQKLYSFILIASLGFMSWYFFIKEYTYEYEITTSLSKNELVSLLKNEYPKTHENLKFIEKSNENEFNFRFAEANVFFDQNIRLSEFSNQEILISIGVNAENRFFKERFQALYKETLVQVYNRFVLLQLSQKIAVKERDLTCP